MCRKIIFDSPRGIGEGRSGTKKENHILWPQMTRRESSDRLREKRRNFNKGGGSRTGQKVHPGTSHHQEKERREFGGGTKLSGGEEKRNFL